MYKSNKIVEKQKKRWDKYPALYAKSQAKTWLLRKEWDSNPRYGRPVRRISSPVHSITLASFLIRVQRYSIFCYLNHPKHFL